MSWLFHAYLNLHISFQQNFATFVASAVSAAGQDAKALNSWSWVKNSGTPGISRWSPLEIPWNPHEIPMKSWNGWWNHVKSPLNIIIQSWCWLMLDDAAGWCWMFILQSGNLTPSRARSPLARRAPQRTASSHNAPGRHASGAGHSWSPSRAKISQNVNWSCRKVASQKVGN